MLNHAIAFSERLNSVVMIYISVVEQLDGGPRECQNQMNQPVNGSNISISRMASSNLSLSIQILSFFLFNLKPCNLHPNSVRLIFRCNIYQENMKQNLLDCKN